MKDIQLKFGLSKRKIGKANWKLLTTEQQFLTADRVAMRIDAVGKRLFKTMGTGVRSVGVGFEERLMGRGKRRVMKNLVVLKLLVTKKRKVPEFAPRYVRVTVTIRGKGKLKGKRRLLAIPTDVVDENERTKAHAAKPLRIKASPKSGQGKVIGGTACALVTVRKSSVKYLLSCHHVARYSLNQVGVVSAPCKISTSTGSLIGVPLGGDPMPVAPWPPSYGKRKPAGVDAAIVKTNKAGGSTVKKKSYWRGGYPKKMPRTKRQWVSLVVNDRPTYTFTPWGSNAKFRVTYVGVVYRKLINYGKSSARIQEVHEYRCAKGYKSKPGFSGSPIVGDGQLVGMNIAGERRNGYNYCYAVPSYAFARPGLLATKGLALAQPN